MMSDPIWIQMEIRRVIDAEDEGLRALSATVDDSWSRVVKVLAECKGKVVVMGLGKTGHIGRKMAATFSSLGTPAFFVHAAEAAHGDLGMIEPEDVVLAISNSGDTAELVGVLPMIKAIGSLLIAMTSHPRSRLAQASDLVLALPDLSEADPLGLAPTTSSTTALAAGDALAVILAEMRGFTRDQFGLFHPGGALGKAVKARRA